MARKRTDSKENAAQIMAKSAVPITVPSNVPLSETDIPFYHNVIGEFARSEWTEHALEIAAMMARTMHDLNTEQQALREKATFQSVETARPLKTHAHASLKALPLICYRCVDHWVSTRGRAKRLMLLIKRH